MALNHKRHLDPWEELPLPGMETLHPHNPPQSLLPHTPGSATRRRKKLAVAQLNNITIPASVIEKFSHKLIPIPEEFGGCHIWTGAIGSDGYGKINFTINGQQITLGTHRFAVLALGEGVGPRRVAEHECNNPLCCRVGPGHLRVTTQKDNILHAIDTQRHHGNRVVVHSTLRRERSLRIRDALKNGWDKNAYLRALSLTDPNQLLLWDER